MRVEDEQAQSATTVATFMVHSAAGEGIGFGPGIPMKTTSSFLIGVSLLALVWLAPAVAETEPTESAKITFLLIYRPGPAWPEGKKVSELPLKEHGNYMLSLYKKGAMKLAGPLTDNAGGAVVLEVS